MPSRESYRIKSDKKRRRTKKETRSNGSLFTTALSLNVRPGSIPSLPAAGSTQDPGTSSRNRLRWTPAPSKATYPATNFWQPIRSFVLSQLTSLVRRSTLKESDLAPKYEKVHNFKVSECHLLCVCVCVGV